MIEKFTALTSSNGLMADKLNEVIDAVNELCSRAGTNPQKTPQNNENFTERENMTVAQLRRLLKQGDNNAQILVNDLVSELPNQITSWIDKDFARYYVGEDLSDSQFEEFWDWMRKEWELVDSSDELRSALEQWMDDHADELD